MTKPLILILHEPISPEDHEYCLVQTRLLPFANVCELLNCETLTVFGYLDDFANDPQITDLCQQKRLAAVIIINDEYDNFYWETFLPDIIKKIRAQSDVNIIVITRNLYEDNDDDEKNGTKKLFLDCDVYRFLHDQKMWQKLKETISQKLKFLSEAEAITIQNQQLQDAYQANYPDDDQLCADDPSTQSAREIMRLRLMQDPNLIKQEFDDVIIKPPKIKGVSDWLDLEPTETFDADCQKVSKMMAQPSGRELISAYIYCMIRTGASTGLGKDCYGFAHDTVTGSVVVINTYGLHSYATHYLDGLVNELYYLNQNIVPKNDNDNKEIRSRFINGIIYKTNITTTPILMLNSHLTEAEKEEFWQWARSQRRFIPIDENDFDR